MEMALNRHTIILYLENLPTWVWMMLALVVAVNLFVFCYLLFLRFKKISVPALSEGEIEGAFSFGKTRYKVIESKRTGAPWLVYLHGWGASQFVWRLLTPAFTEDFNQVTLDIPGFGYSALDDQHFDLSIEAQSHRIVEVLDHLQIKEFIPVGNSMGGALALWLAVQFPERVQSVIALNPASSSRLLKLFPQIPQQLSTQMLKWRWWGLPPIVVKWIYGRVVSKRELLSNDNLLQYSNPFAANPQIFQSLLNSLYLLKDHRLPRELSKIKRPVLILYGNRDHILPAWVMTDTLAEIPTAQFFVHPSGGHHLMEDEPDWVIDRMNRFLQRQQLPSEP